MTVFLIYLLVGVASLVVIVASDYTDGDFSGFRTIFKKFKYGDREVRSGLANDGAMIVIFWPIALYWKIYKTLRHQ